MPWNPWLALLFVVIVYFVSQLAGGLLISIYPALKHWDAAVANNWLQNNVTAQFIYVLLAEVTTVAAVVAYVRHFRVSLATIGLRRPRWSDLAYGLLAVVPYYVAYLILLSVVTHFVPSLNVNQQQEIGFSNVHGTLQLTLTFLSLVVLPPIAEETIMRGLLYTSLKKVMPLMLAALLTSAIFASAHLPEGGAAGPLYVAAIDTFTLSLVLVYLREKTGGLYSSMTLHAIKNGIAFLALFILHAH